MEWRRPVMSPIFPTSPKRKPCSRLLLRPETLDRISTVPSAFTLHPCAKTLFSPDRVYRRNSLEPTRCPQPRGLVENLLLCPLRLLRRRLLRWRPLGYLPPLLRPA